MLTAKKKINVREAVPRSGTSDFLYTSRDWFQSNLKLLGGIVLGVIALGIIGYLFVTGRQKDEIEANLKLQQVQDLYQQQQYKLAISGDPARKIMGLAQITEEYGSTGAGQVAYLFLGNAYLYTGEYDKAEQTFEDASPDNDLMRAAVTAGQASVYEAKKNYAEAAELFKKSAGIFENDLLSSERYFYAGRDFALAGDKEAAKEMLLKVKESPSQQYHQSADRLMAQYGLD